VFENVNCTLFEVSKTRFHIFQLTCQKVVNKVLSSILRNEFTTSLSYRRDFFLVIIFFIVTVNQLFMALNSLYCADAPLRSCSLTHGE